LSSESERGETGRDLAIQSFVGALVSSASLVHPEVAIAASAAAPSMAYSLNRLVRMLSRRRTAHAEEALNDAAEAATLAIEQFIDEALADEKRTELLVRALTTAQDVALREKRRAIGRALAAGVCGTSPVDDEFLFIRALADLDEPHIAVLQVIGREAPAHQPLPRGWLYTEILEQVPGLANALRAILTTLELHTLIAKNQLASEVGRLTDIYRTAHPGLVMLSRLAEEAS
jgi:hypothetical protein